MKHKNTVVKSFKKPRLNSSVYVKHSKKKLPNSAAITNKRIAKNRPLHKRIILHPISVMVIMCTTIFVAGWTYYALAYPVNVTAAIAAPLFTQGATITSPTNNQVVTTSTVNVTGSCPYGSYVTLTRNNLLSGVAWCNQNNTFTITTDLFIGQNTLITQDYNSTNAPGPITSPVNVTYSPLHISPSSKAKSGTNILPFILTTDFQFRAFTTIENYIWNLDIKGGKAPYNIRINWGNNEYSDMRLDAEGKFTIQHKFGLPGYYAINIYATDSAGSKSMLQLAALIKSPGSLNIFTPGIGIVCSTHCNVPASKNNFWTNISQLPKWLIISWPALIIILLMLFSFWLGEKEELELIRNKASR